MLGAGYTVRREREIDMFEGCYELATQLKEQAIHSKVCYGRLSSVVYIFTLYKIMVVE